MAHAQGSVRRVTRSSTRPSSANDTVLGLTGVDGYRTKSRQRTRKQWPRCDFGESSNRHNDNNEVYCTKSPDLRKSDVIVPDKAHTMTTLVVQTNDFRAGQYTFRADTDTDSELSELSSISDFDFAVMSAGNDDIQSVSNPGHLKVSPAAAASTMDSDNTVQHNSMDVNKATSRENHNCGDMHSVQDEDNHCRPSKRIKLAVGKAKSVTSASAQDEENAPALIDDQSSTPPPSSPVELASGPSTISILSSTDTTLPALLSPSLPSKLNSIAADHLKTPSLPEKQSLKMTILPKSEVETLKSHNGILRSHNLSLARQNADLRRDNTQAMLLYEEVKDVGPIDHSKCVSKDDYQLILAENQRLTDDMTKIRRNNQLMKECSYEWARRENLWEIEQQLLRNEVTELMGSVRGLKAQEQELIRGMNVIEAKAQQEFHRANQEAARARGLEDTIHRARAHMAAMQREVVQKSGKTPEGKASVYPEL